jgi:hypothetical protein
MENKFGRPQNRDHFWSLKNDESFENRNRLIYVHIKFSIDTFWPINIPKIIQVVDDQL